MIYYICPDSTVKSGGKRRLYRHVDILNRNGISAAILHGNKPFKVPDTPDVPIRYLNDQIAFQKQDILVIPEVLPQLMLAVKNLPLRKFVIALNILNVFNFLPENENYKTLAIERVLVVSPFIGKFISWSMDIPAHLLPFSIDNKLYYYDAGKEKENTIVFLGNKSQYIPAFKKILFSRNHTLASKFKWQALQDISLNEYAAQIRKAKVFLTLSTSEGLPNSSLEAMASGTIVVGFNGGCPDDRLIPIGERQNCILAPTMELATLAMHFEPYLKSLEEPNNPIIEKLRQNALETVAPHTPEKEEKELVAFWQSIV